MRIHRFPAVTILVICLFGSGHPLGAQQRPLSPSVWSEQPLRTQQRPLTPSEIGRIADEALEALIPPGTQLSRVAVDQRTIFFDHRRTLEAFGIPEAAGIPLSDLGIERPVQEGTESLLEDCRAVGRGPCSRLGWGVYVWIRPLDVTDSTATVVVNVFWPDRGEMMFEEGVAPEGAASYVGYGAEVHLTRGPDGQWEFAGLGVFYVS